MRKMNVIAGLSVDTPVWNPWQAHAQFFFLTLGVTRQEIIQFTTHDSVKTVMFHTFFHSENHISVQTFFSKLIESVQLGRILTGAIS